MGAKAPEVASLARGACLRRSLRPFSRPSERFLDRGSRGFGAERFLSSREERLIDLNSGSPRHVYIIQNDCVHIPPRVNAIRLPLGDTLGWEVNRCETPRYTVGKPYGLLYG